MSWIEVARQRQWPTHGTLRIELLIASHGYLDDFVLFVNGAFVS
jgi:hypothetical protein